MFVLLCTIVVVTVVISLLFHCIFTIFNLIHLFGYPSRKCVLKSVFGVQCKLLRAVRTDTGFHAT